MSWFEIGAIAIIGVLLVLMGLLLLMVAGGAALLRNPALRRPPPPEKMTEVPVELAGAGEPPRIITISSDGRDPCQCQYCNEVRRIRQATKEGSAREKQS